MEVKQSCNPHGTYQINGDKCRCKVIILDVFVLNNCNLI